MTVALLAGAVLLGAIGAGSPTAPFNPLATVVAGAEGACPDDPAAPPPDPAAPPAECPPPGDPTPVEPQADDTTTTTVPETTTSTEPPTTTTTVPETTTTTAPPPVTTTTLAPPTTTTTLAPTTTTTAWPTTTTTARPATTTTRPGSPTPGPTTTTTARPSTSTTVPTTGGTGPPPSGGTTTPAPSGATTGTTTPPASNPTVGGFLLTPRAGEAQSPTPATGPKAGPTTTSSTAPDLSPRVPSANQGAGAGADPLSPSPEEAQLGLPDQLALGEILRQAEVAFPGADGAAPAGDSLPSAEAAPAFTHAGHSRWPQIAGLIVTLAILFFGGGFLWWRNRDSQYWPA